MRLTEQQIRSLYGQDVQDRSSAKIGSVGQVWADAAGEPTWVSVATGVMGHHESMAPLQSARMQQDKLSLPYDKATVRGAPSVETGTDEPLDARQLAQLYAHYQLQQPTAQAPQQGPPRQHTAGYPRGPELTRSEERLLVGTESEPAGTARLRKHVVDEDVHTTVPVEHDEVRVEREPIAPGDRRARAEIGDEQQELRLRAEHPVVSKEQVPVERVRLTRDEVVEDQPVDERLRRERVEADVPQSARRR
ncbi:MULTISPECIES: YsnF/AvaK domain-containing protein [unclassified Micromonospora]|uniref:YsnF/AvaK domain-containing protein n=1 Tax=unclassified Micromonospora TaxID=2617518 RepID=UPI0036425130